MNKKLLAAILPFLLLTGCIYRAASKDNTVQVYRMRSEDGCALVSESVELKTGQSRMDAAAEALNVAPSDERLESALPDDVQILSVKLVRGRAQVCVSDGYAKLEGMEKTLAEYAIVYTFTSIDEVLSVDIICKNTTVAYGLTACGAVLGDAEYGGCRTIIKLFLPDESMRGLKSRSYTVSDEADACLAEQTAELLIGELKSMPDAARILSVTLENGLCTVNMSEELYATEPDDERESALIIGAVINSLTYLPEVDSVTIQVNGVPITSYGGYTTVWPKGFDDSLIIY